jgi:antitoxin VapB
MKTKLFKNGNSQAVRIPAELAYETWDIELDIERRGDEIVIKPTRQRIGNVMQIFAGFSSNFEVNGRGKQTQKERSKL